MRKIIPILAFLLALPVFLACSTENKNGQAQNQNNAAEPAGNTGKVPTGEINVAGGLTWDVPSEWKVGPTQQMRIATYIIQAAEGDADNADCAVFHFPGTGGAKEANLRRWEGQFEQPDGRNSSDVAIIEETESNNLKVTTIELNGIYKVAGGPMMEVRDKKPGYRLMGAIIEGPRGPVFFKMVGPEKTVTAAQEQFMGMVKSVKIET
jgi:hypothetical protein